MSNFDDISLRNEATGPLSGSINNFDSRAGLGWYTLEHLDYKIKSLHGMSIDINKGWKDIITGTGYGVSFSSLNIKPLFKFATVPFIGDGDYTPKPATTTIPTRPGEGIYGMDGAAVLLTNNNNNIPEEQRYSPTYATYDYGTEGSDGDIYVRIPRAASQFLPSKGHDRIRLDKDPTYALYTSGDSWDASSGDSWDASSKMTDFIWHRYPTLNYLISDHALRSESIINTYEYRGTNIVNISPDSSRTVILVFDVDDNNMDINVLLKFSSSVVLGDVFDVSIHYKSNKITNIHNIDPLRWPKVIICDDSSRLNCGGNFINGMYSTLVRTGINGAPDDEWHTEHGVQQYSYMAMLGGVPCISQNGVYGCIGRQAILESTANINIANRWCEYNSSAELFTDTASYYIRLIKTENGMYPLSIVPSYNTSQGMYGE